MDLLSDVLCGCQGAKILLNALSRFDLRVRRFGLSVVIVALKSNRRTSTPETTDTRIMMGVGAVG